MVLSRRSFIKSSVAGAAIIGSGNAWAHDFNRLPKPVVCAFSRLFDWMGDDMFAFLADAGLDGIDLTVRPDGFVEPANVERGLEQAVVAAQKHGLKIPMIATAITDVSDPLTERILKTASETGVTHYRLGYYSYNDKITTEQNLELFKRHLTALCELNARYHLNGGYQNHAGAMFGSPVWDLWFQIKDIDARYIGCQYDIRHAVAEGFSSWPLGLKAICSHVKQMCIKDFIYEKAADGNWRLRSVPLGTGVVDFKTYFGIIRECGVSGPFTIHYEFPLIDKSDESLSAKEKRKKMLHATAKEADMLRTYLNSYFNKS